MPSVGDQVDLPNETAVHSLIVGQGQADDEDFSSEMAYGCSSYGCLALIFVAMIVVAVLTLGV